MNHKRLEKLMIVLSVGLVIMAVLVVVFLQKSGRDIFPVVFQDPASETQEKPFDIKDFTAGIEAGTFDLNEYKTLIHQFRANYSVGAIDSAQAAAESAIRIWGQSGYNVRNYSQPQVFYDSNAACWLVISSPPNLEPEEGVAYVYETPIILIQADGTVLAKWLK